MIVNALFAAVVLALLMSVLEATGRLLEKRRPDQQVAHYIWNWERRWGGDFYTVATRTVGWPPTLEFNGLGLRDRTHPREKGERAWRVVFLGDSVTMGDQIEARDAFPQVLDARFEKQGRRIEALNVSLWGWSTRQERIAYERLVRPFRPDQVILGVCLNDVPELQNNLDRPPPWLAFLHRRSAFVRCIVNAPGREIASVDELFRSSEAPTVRRGFERLFSELRLVRDAVRSDGARLGILIFPFRFQFMDDAPPPLAQQRIVEFCRREAIPWIDLLPALSPAGASGFVDYDHLSVAGARLVADAIESSGWLPSGYSYSDDLLRSESGRPLSTKALIRALSPSQDAAAREAAVWALGRTTDPPDLAVSALAAALTHDASRGVRAAAAHALRAHSDAARPVAGALFSALHDESEHVRYEAAQALWRIEIDPISDVPRLIQALHSDHVYVRAFAAWMLAKIGPDARAAVPALVAAIKGGRDDGGLATRALERIGSQAEPAVPTLIAALRNDDLHIRAEAARALGRIGSRNAVDALAASLSDQDSLVRSEAARALGRIGAGAETAVPALARLLSDPDEQTRAMAARALGFIPGAVAAVPQLNAARKDEAPRVAREAEKALRRIHAAQ